METTAGRRVLWQTDRLFFTGMALASVLTLVVGFAPTYFARSSTLPPLSPLYHLHGAVFTSWIVLFFVQTILVARRRTDIHRRLGAAGAVLAFVVLIAGVTVSVETLRRGGGTHIAEPHAFLAIPLGDMITFALPWWKGLGADSEEKREPVSDIDIAAVDSLKLLDPKRPIREATKKQMCLIGRYVPIADIG